MARNDPRRTARRRPAIPRAAALVAGLLALLGLGTGDPAAWAYDARACDAQALDAQAPDAPPAFPYAGEEDGERFGVGHVTGPLEAYDLEGLGARWYLNWGVREDPARPGGVGYMQTVRLKDGVPRVSDERLRELVEANPGATWQIGNEPDSPWLDDTLPQDYAAAYHHLYHVIKDQDATALVANGGLVQATPLRMAYLDRIWETYEAEYGGPMPVDVWTVHGFILPEKDTWGAGIPPGMGDQKHLGADYEWRETDSLDIFAEQIVRFRQWMADHGQRHKPLIVNEYAILWPSDYRDEDGVPFDDERVVAFMEGTFDFFRSATDIDIGYPADGDRLVQRWAWYSLDDDIYRDGEVIGEMYNGDLFTGAVTKTMTALGRAYGTYVVGDLAVESLAHPTSLMMEAGETVSATVAVGVGKAGGLEPMDAVEVELRAEGTAEGELTRTWTIGPFEAEATRAYTVTVTLPYDEPGAHGIVVEVDGADAVKEMDEDNNTAAGVVLVATDRVFLPVIVRAPES